VRRDLGELYADGSGVWSGMSERFSFLLVNPHLRDRRGHYLPYDLSIREQARQSKHRIFVFGSREVEPSVRAALDVIPLFPSSSLVSPPRWSPRLRRLNGVRLLLQANAGFLVAFRKMLGYGAGAPRVLFFPNCGYLGEVLGLALGLVSAPSDPDTRYVLLFRYTAPGASVAESRRRVCMRWAFWLLERAARRHAIRLVTDSDRLGQAYKALTSLPFQLVPIPHVPPARSALSPDHQQRGETAPPRLVYLGGARKEQGIHLLVDSLTRLREKLANGAFSATIHLNPPPDDASAVESCWRLENAALENVRILRGVLPRADYEHILHTADVMVIPYLAERYNSRTSGVLTEALSLGKPAIVPRDTWMGDQASRGGGVLFDGETSEDLARAIEAAFANLDELKARAAVLRPEWNSFHNPENLYRHLVQGLSLGET
jgi:glycosyltransferase involved in cell wall biosynthesis